LSINFEYVAGATSHQIMAITVKHLAGVSFYCWCFVNCRTKLLANRGF